MALYDKTSTERIFTLMEQMRDQLSHAIDTGSEGVPFGFTKVDDNTFRVWFEQQVALSPPMLIVHPNGTQFIASPWVTMLSTPDLKGGRAMLTRYERITGGR